MYEIQSSMNTYFGLPFINNDALVLSPMDWSEIDAFLYLGS